VDGLLAEAAGDSGAGSSRGHLEPDPKHEKPPDGRCADIQAGDQAGQCQQEDQQAIGLFLGRRDQVAEGDGPFPVEEQVEFGEEGARAPAQLDQTGQQDQPGRLKPCPAALAALIGPGNQPRKRGSQLQPGPGNEAKDGLHATILTSFPVFS